MRIISLVPSLTELVCELGLSQYLVGRTGFCIHPHAQIINVPKVGGTKDINLKKIRALKPTHVIVNKDENRLEDAQALSEFVPQVVVTHPLTARDNLSLYKQFGEVFGEVEACSAKSEVLQQLLLAELELCQIELQNSTNIKALYLIWRDPWITISSETYIADMLRQVGVQTVTPVSNNALRYPTVSDHEAAALQPELILFSSEPYSFNEKHFADTAAWAAANVPRVMIDGEMTSWYGSRAISGLRYLREFKERLSK